MTSGAGATYGYNAQNLRTSKTVGNETDSFTLVSGNVWSDGDADYFRGIELISNGTQLYLYNIRGDVIQLTDLSGNVTKTYDYDAYGNELQRDLADENPFRYCGEYYDTETGFIYLRARYYDPLTGRFTSIDPVKDGLNWYAYCSGDPVNLIDPRGTEEETFWEYIARMAQVGENEYALIDNYRNQVDGVFHEQGFYIETYTPSVAVSDKRSMSGSFTGFSFELLKGSWNFASEESCFINDISIGLLNVFKLEGMVDVTNKLKFSGFISAWNPEISFDIFGMRITIGADVLVLGASSSFVSWSPSKSIDARLSLGFANLNLSIEKED